MDKISSENISSHINDESSYINIPINIVSSVFRNFDKFTDDVDKYRQSKGRIRETPNNIVSSRSVIFYDFILEIDNKNVPFLIIDLPGREEIYQTYIEPYISNEYISKLLFRGMAVGDISNQKIFIKSLLTSMSLNPISVPIYDPMGVIEIFNELNEIDRKDILNTNMKFKFRTESGENTSNVVLLDETIGKTGRKISDIFTIENNKLKYDLKTNEWKGFGYKSYKQTNEKDKQKYGVVGIHLINRIINLKRFDMLDKIFNKLVDKHVNNKIITELSSIEESKIKPLYDGLINTNFKAEILSGIPNLERTKEKIKQYIKYDYVMTSYEGIYINENIAGLIKYLGSKLFVSEKDKIAHENLLRKKMIQKSLTFQEQQRVSRISLISTKKNDDNSVDSIRDFYFYEPNEKIPTPMLNENLIYKYDVMDEKYNDLAGSYKSDNIYNFDKPLITDILDPYLKKINDYKVFYLFGNYPDENTIKLKCSHQINLLNNTSDFIGTIIKN